MEQFKGCVNSYLPEDVKQKKNSEIVLCGYDL